MGDVRVHATGKPEWLSGLEVARAEPEVCRVREIFPPGYASYLRLFHPFIPWGSDPATIAPADRMTWAALATAAGSSLRPTLQWDTLRPVLPLQEDRRPYEVHTGELEPSTRRRLFSHLTDHTTSSAAYFLYDLAAVIAGGDPFTIEAAASDIDAVVRWVEERNAATVSTPELVWPADRQWIVCTDYDLPSTYLAVGEALAADLLKDSTLEIVAVDLDTRVDYRADVDQRPSEPPTP